ncbi:hypothetical protein BUALT_Bualt05G0105200 [Buddleja alternifolia]|uniref:Uncharacterized protein n=1 Tax=Buddleja alternifolia TaxID=168488 RepID=A0AAV6XTZ5_9LAMI|nr:hypothetical protein BUALT_Bualt05G0105200 [Buddleja alternifolia]
MAAVLYDHTTNTIIGAPFVWDHICKEQPFAYAYMSEGDPKWTELQVIFNDAPTSNQLFLDNVVNVSLSDEDDSMFIVENRGVLFGPVMQGLPVYDMPLGEAEYPINAPFLQALPVINVFSDDIRSPDNNFWNDMFEEWGSDSLSGGYVDPNDDLLLQEDATAVHFSKNRQYELPSPINSLNSIEVSGGTICCDSFNAVIVVFCLSLSVLESFIPPTLSLKDLPPLFVIRSNISRGDTLTLYTASSSTAFRFQQSNDGLLCLSGSEWTQFVTANELNETYMFLMIHRGNMHFNVKVFDQSALCIESDGDEDDNEDANDANPLLPDDVIDVEDYDENDGDSDVEVVKMFCITVPPSSGYNYRHARLARLTIPTHPLMGYNLLDFNLAVLKVPVEGNSTWSVNLKWISSYSSSGEVGRQSFAFKEGWFGICQCKSNQRW